MSRLIKTVAITLDRPRELKCDFNAITLIQQYTGRNLLAGDDPVVVLDGDRKIINPSGLRGTLAALLTADNEKASGFIKTEMTPEFAGSLIGFDNMLEIANKCVEAINNYFPVPQATETADPLAQTATASSPA